MEYPVSIITGVLLADGWHNIAPGSFHVDSDPSFSDPTTGASATLHGGSWLRFIEIATGILYAAPIDRIESIRTLLPPTAALTATPTTGTAPLTVDFSAAGSVAGSGALAVYTFNFGDASGLTGPQSSPATSHTYTASGTFASQVTVTDVNGLPGISTRTITVTL